LKESLGRMREIERNEETIEGRNRVRGLGRCPR
jgi:hypothetical protein